MISNPDPNKPLEVLASSFDSPVNAKFDKIQWRLAEVSLPGIDGYDSEKGCKFESLDHFQSTSSNNVSSFSVPHSVLETGKTYRVRVPACRHSQAVEPMVSADSVLLRQRQIFLSSAISALQRSCINPLLPQPRNAPYPLFASDYEFLELHNFGTGPVSLRGVRITEGIEFSFDTSSLVTIGAKETMILARNRSAFAARYPDKVTNVVGEWRDGRLSDKGETVTLSLGWFHPIQSVSYLDSDEWPAEANGSGASLVLSDPALPPQCLQLECEPNIWRNARIALIRANAKRLEILKILAREKEFSRKLKNNLFGKEAVSTLAGQSAPCERPLVFSGVF